MDMVTVASSNLQAIGYHATTRRLRVAFHIGGVYEYSGVPESVHAALMAAGSHGTYFDAYIKKEPYPCRRVG